MNEFDPVKKVLLDEINSIQEEQVLMEILDFVRFLKSKPDMDTYLAGYSSLAKDWLTPEEDEAWQDL